jgi:hypothetical protein
MELRIEPSADMNIKLQNKVIGKLEALVLDISSGGGLLGIPKVKLEVSLDRGVFVDDEGFTNVLNKLKKFSFLKVNTFNSKKG